VVTSTLQPHTELVDAGISLQRAREHLLGLQDPKGFWKAELETNVTMDAEDLLLRHFLGILDHHHAEATAQWIRSQQRQDGTWATFYGGPPDLSTTVEAYVGLRLAGDDLSGEHMRLAASWVRSNGGIEATRVFTRIWLAAVGAWDWGRLPVIPPEIMFLPKWAPLNIYDFACWARQTIVALTVVMAHRPVRQLPFGLEELRAAGASTAATATGSASADATAGGPFAVLDRLLNVYEQHPFGPLRRAALARAARWIVDHQEADGSWGGIQPPLVYSLMALNLLGYRLDHPVMRKGLEAIEAFCITDSRGRRVEACQSPVWDTALAVVALTEGDPDPVVAPALAAAASWLATKEVSIFGDWSLRRPQLAPGGWAFEFCNEHYPDIDDTAEVVMALRRAAQHGCGDFGEACRRGVNWVVGMQSRNGGWGAFDADNDDRLVAALPFCDFGEVTDPPSADVTAHALEMLAAEPSAPPRALSRARAWLFAQQEPDGSWFGRWGVNHLYGTGAALPALVAAGVSPQDHRIRAAVSWLERCQNPDGGWGEDVRSYIDDSWRGRGTSTPSQTAWALLGLVAAGEAHSSAARRGVRFLTATQTPDGTWDEPQFTGTGFPWDFSINYHLYRIVWPVMALGRWLRTMGNPAMNGGEP
jgi:squalene-hopene/tetraprenyl-beta-curcumene cyclase